MWPSSPSRTCRVDRPRHTTSAKYGEMWLSACAVTQRLVRRGQHRQARAEAGAEDADPLVSLIPQPPDRPPRVEHRLPADLQRPSHVRADDVVGARELGRHAPVVIRQAQAQRAHAEPRENPREADMARSRPSSIAPAPAPRACRGADGRAGKYRACTTLFSTWGVTSALGNVSARRFLGAGCMQLVCGGWRWRVKGVRVGEDVRDVLLQLLRGDRPGARDRSAGPSHPPLKRTHEPIGGGRGETPLPTVKQRSQHVDRKDRTSIARGVARQRVPAASWASMLQRIGGMIEQPSNPQPIGVPDVIDSPPPDVRPVPPPDIQPVPPPDVFPPPQPDIPQPGTPRLP